jgi:hypothetical protein
LEDIGRADYLVANPLADFPKIKSNLLLLKDSLTHLMPNFLTYQKMLGNLSFSALQTALVQQPNNASVAAVESISQQISKLSHIADSLRLISWKAAEKLNNKIKIDNDYTELERHVNQILLSALLRNSENSSTSSFLDEPIKPWTPTGADSVFIKETAFLCPQDAGEAVLKARSVWIQMGNAIDKVWENCFPEDSETANRSNVQNEKKSQSDKANVETPKVYPVPTAALLNIVCPEVFVGAKFKVFNAIGTEMLKGTIFAQTTFLEVADWQNGLYYLQISVEKSHPVTLKVIVQK